MPQADGNWHGKMAEAWETLANGEWRRRLLSLDALQIFDDRLDIVWLEHKDRHVRVTGDDPIGKRLGQILDRVFGGQRPKGRRFLVRAVSFSTDRMAARAVLPDEHLALVDRGIACGGAGPLNATAPSVPSCVAISALSAGRLTLHDGTIALLPWEVR